MCVLAGLGLLMGCAARTGDKTLASTGAGSTPPSASSSSSLIATPAPVPIQQAADLAAALSAQTQLQAELDAALLKIHDLETNQAGLFNFRVGNVDLATAGAGTLSAVVVYLLMRVTGIRPQSAEERRKASVKVPDLSKGWTCSECGQIHGSDRA
jgi:hypothetical protein